MTKYEVKPGEERTTGRPSMSGTRRPQILRAFESCVLRYGLEGSSLERIAAEAGVRRSLIRHYFGNRPELTQALIDGVLERTIENYRDVIARAGASGGMENLIDYLAGSSFAEERDDALIDEMMAASRRHPELRAQLRANYQGFQRSIAHELRKAFPGSDAREVRTVAYGLMCLAVGNAAMHDLELPSRTQGHAQRVAREMVLGFLG
jgi:AcrR family transcriptional regulator